MSRTSCLPEVSKDRFITIRKWQIAFCDGDICGASLISFFGTWHDTKMKMKPKNKKMNEIAELNGYKGEQDISLLQFHTLKEIVDGILNLYKKDKVIQSIKLLMDRGILTKHKNPNTKYKFDKTNFYLFDEKPLKVFSDAYSENRLSYSINRQAITDDTTDDSKNSLNKFKDSDSNESPTKDFRSNITRKIVPIVKAKKDISDRQVNKASAKKPKKKYFPKHCTDTDLKYFKWLVDLDNAIKHKIETKAYATSIDKIHKLFSKNPRCKPPYYLSIIPKEYIDYKWNIEEVLYAFKFQLEHEKNPKKLIRSIGQFIFSEGFNGNAYSPLIKWHTAMKKGITGKLDEKGELLFKSLKQRGCVDVDNLQATAINNMVKIILPIENKYVFMNGKSSIDGYALGIISVASEYIKGLQNKIDFKWRWITNDKFADELLEHVLKYNIMKKKSSMPNINFARKVKA